MSDLRIVCLCRKFDAHLKDFCCNRMCCSKSRQAALETNEAQTLSINCIFLSVKLGFDNWNFLSVYSRAQGLRVIPCWNKFGEKCSFFSQVRYAIKHYFGMANFRLVQQSPPSCESSFVHGWFARGQHAQQYFRYFRWVKLFQGGSTGGIAKVDLQVAFAAT